MDKTIAGSMDRIYIHISITSGPEKQALNCKRANLWKESLEKSGELTFVGKQFCYEIVPAHVASHGSYELC